MQEASDAHSKTADSDTVSTYQVSSVQLVTDKKLQWYYMYFSKLENTFLFLYFIWILLNLQMYQIILPDPVYIMSHK